jgi:hypothetical protein
MKWIIAMMLMLVSSELLAVVPPPCIDNPGHPSCNANKTHSVPEPAAPVLIGTGLVAMSLLRRFRK